VKRATLILLALGIAAFAVFLALRSRAPDANVAEPGAQGERDAGPEAAPRELEAGPAAIAALAASGADERASVVLPAPDETPSAGGWTVCVLDGDTGAPVADASVSVLDTTETFRATAARGIGFDTLAGLRLRRESAREARTDLDGCARFDAPPANASVEARHDVRWAFTVVNAPPPDGRVVLRLGFDRELCVRVVDETRAPVGGVPVAVRRATRPPPRVAYTYKWTDTDPCDGIATFLHFQRRLEQGADWQATFAFPLLDQPAIPVDARTPSEPPLELVLPATGRLLVRVRAPDGGVPGLDDVELRLEATDAASGTTAAAPIWLDGPWSTPRLDAAGEALVPWLGLGLRVRAKLVRDDVTLAEATCFGPAAPREQAVCDVRWDTLAARFVTGRFVLSDGRAWPAATVLAEPRIIPLPPPTAERPRERELTLDANGRFRLQVDVARPAGGSRSYRFSATHPDGAGTVGAVVPLDQELPPEGLELGDVLLDRGRLLAAGRVVDHEHRGIEGAVVGVRTRTVVEGQEFWPGVASCGTERTRDDGTFARYLELGEREPQDTLRLFASARGYVGEPAIDVRCGARDVEIVLARAGGLAGSLALGDGYATAGLALFLFGTSTRFVPLRDDATFEEPALEPGVYALEVRALDASRQATPKALARVDGLVVRAGETCRDSRIQGLRIESERTVLRIRVLDRASAPIARAAVSVVGATPPRDSLSGNDGLAFVECDALPVDLDVRAFGFARRRLDAVAADQDVVLEAGIPVRLHTSARTRGSEPNFTLRVELYSLEAGARGPQLAWGREVDLSNLAFDERGELCLRLPAPGTYECGVFVTVFRPDRVGSGKPVALAPPLRLDVRASDLEQLFELPIRDDAVDAAVREALR
jgi:hypothetical protein